MKRVLKIILWITGVCLGIMIIGLVAITKDIPTVSNMNINEVRIESVKDGVYKGRYEYSRWLSEVKVEVKDKKIRGIELLSPMLTPDISQELFENIINRQKLSVDVVSGATATSKVHLKAVEHALTNKE